jgi:F-type H+-transporting ATPase subunit epsilon
MAFTQSMQIEILTPERRALQAEVRSVNLQGAAGRMGILPRHTALIAKLDFGMLEYESADGKHGMLCGQGMVEVSDDKVTILARSAESADQVDADRAKQALARAKSRINSKDSDVDIERAEAALKRALYRLRFIDHL